MCSRHVVVVVVVVVLVVVVVVVVVALFPVVTCNLNRSRRLSTHEEKKKFCTLAVQDLTTVITRILL